MSCTISLPSKALSTGSADEAFCSRIAVLDPGMVVEIMLACEHGATELAIERHLLDGHLRELLVITIIVKVDSTVEVRLMFLQLF